MVNAKKEKKGVGAERRREEKLDQYYSELKQRRKSSGKSSKSEKGKRKPKKKEGGEPTESRVNWQLVGALLRRVAALAFTILIFSRSNIGEAFGTGTGINKAQVSPVNIVVHSLLHADFIKKDKQFNAKAKLVSQALIYPSVYIGPYMPKKMQPLPSKMKYGGNGPKDSAWDKANAVMKTIDNDQGLKKLMAYENKDMVVVAAVGIILGGEMRRLCMNRMQQPSRSFCRIWLGAIMLAPQLFA
jgi:hypothetical protein